MTKSMTEGRPLRLIFEFALPLLVGNLLQQLYNVIDAAIVGRALGSDALGAVGASSSVQFLVLGFCIGICCGFGIPLAASFGEGNMKKMRGYIFNSLVLTAMFAVVITAACAFFCKRILVILSAPEDIFADAYIYLLIIFLGIPFNLLYNILAAVLRAAGDSVTPFVFLAVSAVTNIILDVVFIILFGWGCAGAAAATVTAQGISGLLCAVFVKKRLPELVPSAEDRRINRYYAKNLVFSGIPMGLQYSITAIGSMVMQSANNGLGSIYVSGFTAGMRIKQFIMCPFDAVATAVSVFCGQNLGAGKTERIRKGILSGIAAVVIYGIAAGMILIFGGRVLSMIFIDPSDTVVLDAAGKYLRCLGFFYWALGTLCVCRMSTQGLGYSGRAVLSGAAEMAARIFVSLVFVKSLGFDAICWADQSAWVCACLYIVPMCFHCVRKAERASVKKNADQGELL